MTNRRSTPETIRLVTLILDHESPLAASRQCWTGSAVPAVLEFELALDEAHPQMPHHRLLCSRTPERGHQEIWALLLTHYAILDLMCEADDDMDADDGLDVDELSIVRSLVASR